MKSHKSLLLDFIINAAICTSIPFFIKDFNLLWSLLIGVTAGAFTTFLFQNLSLTDKNPVASHIKKNFVELDSPEVLYSGWCSQKRGWLADGGKLYLLPTELVFRPHSLNTASQEYTIYLKDIFKVQPLKSFGKLRGIRVSHQSGKDDFMLEQSNDQVQQWLSQLEEVRIIDRG